MCSWIKLNTCKGLLDPKNMFRNIFDLFGHFRPLYDRINEYEILTFFHMKFGNWPIWPIRSDDRPILLIPK